MKDQTPTDPSGSTARDGRENAADRFWLDEQAFVIFGRQLETPAVHCGTVMLLLDRQQSLAVEKKNGGSLLVGQQWLKRYCELKGSFLLYAPHSDAAFEGAFLLEDFTFEVFGPARALAMGVGLIWQQNTPPFLSRD